MSLFTGVVSVYLKITHDLQLGYFKNILSLCL